MKNLTCKDCVFFELSQSECRLNPPNSTLAAIPDLTGKVNPQVVSFFPRVDPAGCWCGELVNEIQETAGGLQ
jgi:hypothetical protein